MKINPKKCVEDLMQDALIFESRNKLIFIAENNGIDIVYEKYIPGHAIYLYEDRTITIKTSLNKNERDFAIAYCLGRILFCDDVYEFCFDGNKNYDKIDSGENAHGFGVEFAKEFLNGV